MVVWYRRGWKHASGKDTGWNPMNVTPLILKKNLTNGGKETPKGTIEAGGGGGQKTAFRGGGNVVSLIVALSKKS